jgi:hypothetical protein
MFDEETRSKKPFLSSSHDTGTASTRLSLRALREARSKLSLDGS